MIKRDVLAGVRGTFRAVATTVVPDAVDLDDPGWQELEGLAAEALAWRPPALARSLRLLLWLVQWAPVLRWGRPFTALDPDRRIRVLRFAQEAPVGLLRRGFWGLRTLVLLGYYGRAKAAAEIGYRADLRGWEGRP